MSPSVQRYTSSQHPHPDIGKRTAASAHIASQQAASGQPSGAVAAVEKRFQDHLQAEVASQAHKVHREITQRFSSTTRATQ